MTHPLFAGIFLFINALCISCWGLSTSVPRFFYPWSLILVGLAFLSSYLQPAPLPLPQGATQIGISLESVFLLATALAVLGWILGNPQGERKRLWIFRTYGWAVAATGILALIYADGTGNSSKDPLGLAAVVDDGTSVSTIGGLSRSTYATLASTVTASSGTLTLAKMDTLWNAVVSGSQKPSISLTTEAVFAFYGQLLRPQERIERAWAL